MFVVITLSVGMAARGGREMQQISIDCSGIDALSGDGPALAVPEVSKNSI